MSKNDELLRHVRKAIEAEGVRILSIRFTGSGHRCFVFEVAGRRGIVVFASSPARGRDLNAITSARRTVRATRAAASRS